jgi:hypothetical protein
MIGSIGDARLNVLVTEHWYRVFQGEEPVRDLPIYYPQKNTLGASAPLFAYSVPYSLLRIFGLDMFWAMQVVLILFYLLGGFGLFWLLNRKFKIRIMPALLGVAVFILSNNYFVKSPHTQFFTIGLVPWLLILLYGFFENINKTFLKRVLYGISAILMMGLMTLSEFYITYFTLLFLIIVGCVWCIYSGIAGEKPLFKIYNFFRNNFYELLLYFGVGVIALLPSIWVFGPVITQYGGRDFSEVVLMLPRWYDILNVSSDNLVWGKLFKLIPQDQRPLSWELMTGFPIVTFFSFVGCVFYFLKRFRERIFQFNVRLPLVIGTSILVVMLLILRIFDFSLWEFFYKFVPGASALRGIARFNMFLSLPIGIVLAFGAEELFIKIKLINWKKIILFFFVLFFFILENTMVRSNSFWSIREQQEFLTKVVPPPQDCKIFVALNDEDKNLGFFDPPSYNLDAHMIAIKFKIFTINGYTGFTPLVWGGYPDPNKLPLYIQGIREWSRVNNLHNLCAYDPINNKWAFFIKT